MGQAAWVGGLDSMHFRSDKVEILFNRQVKEYTFSRIRMRSKQTHYYMGSEGKVVCAGPLACGCKRPQASGIVSKRKR